jgi:hypothetical protein
LWAWETVQVLVQHPAHAHWEVRQFDFGQQQLAGTRTEAKNKKIAEQENRALQVNYHPKAGCAGTCFCSSIFSTLVAASIIGIFVCTSNAQTLQPDSAVEIQWSKFDRSATHWQCLLQPKSNGFTAWQPATHLAQRHWSPLWLALLAAASILQALVLVPVCYLALLATEAHHMARPACVSLAFHNLHSIRGSDPLLKLAQAQFVAASAGRQRFQRPA